MLDPVLLRGQLEDVARRLATRGFELDSAAIEALEARRKAVADARAKAELYATAAGNSVGNAVQISEVSVHLHRDRSTQGIPK